jgi:hypothetical protein
MVPRRAHRAKRARDVAREREVHRAEHGARCSGRSVPRSGTHDGVSVEHSSAAAREVAYARDIAGIVRECEVVWCCVLRLTVLEREKQLRVGA